MAELELRQDGRTGLHSPADYIPAKDAPPVARGFDSFIRIALPRVQDYEGRRKTALAWFDSRVTWGALKHWRVGRRAMPVWAREKIIAQVKRRIAELQHVLALLESKSPGE